MFDSILNHSQGYNLQNRFSNLVKDQSTGSPSFTPTCFKPFCFNAPCQFTPLFNLHSIILSLMPFSWLHAHSKLRQLLCVHHLVQTVWFICMYIFCSTYKYRDDKPNQGTRGKKPDKTINNCSNHNSTNKYELWVIRWVCSKACESEYDYLWQRQQGMSAICDKLCNYNIGWNKKTDEMTNTTHDLTIIILTYTKLVKLKPLPNSNKNLNSGNNITELLKAVSVNLVTCDDTMEHVSSVTYVCKLFAIPFQFT